MARNGLAKDTPAMREAARQLYAETPSSKAVALKIGVSDTTIRRWLHADGVVFRYRKLPDLRKEACRLYAEGLAAEAIAARLGSSGRTVLRWLEIEGVARRAPWEPLRGRKIGYIPKPGRRGEKAYNWKGKRAPRGTIHNWLNRRYPRKGICLDCGAEGKTDYAFLRHPKPHSRNIDDYREMCHACHLRMDARDRRRRKEEETTGLVALSA